MAQAKLQKVVIKSEEKCPECGKDMVLKSSRFGKFWACSDYPNCTGKKNVAVNRGPAPEPSDEKCPKCGEAMVIRTGRYGKFLACSKYPECKTTKKIFGQRKTYHVRKKQA